MFMLLALPTGIFYFVWAVVGICLTIPFFLFIFGIPFALLFLGSVRILSHVEGRIVEGLLGVRMPRRLPAQSSGETIWARIGEALADIRTWSSLLYLLLRLPLGVSISPWPWSELCCRQRWSAGPCRSRTLRICTSTSLTCHGWTTCFIRRQVSFWA